MTTAISLDARDDGLYYEDNVGAWVEDKYRLVSLYETLFSTGMKHKWEKRVYIDLYSGPGLVRLRGTSRFLWSSPLLALQVKDPFDKYVFCESDAAALDALRRRVEKHFPQADVCYVSGDCNANVAEVCSKIPKPSKDSKVLSFCFVDPYDLSVKFSTISKIADRFVDFLILLALGMDANRNYEHYVEGDSTKIDEALGNREWRERWKAVGIRRGDFRPFLAGEFCRSMESLGYLKKPLDRMKLVRSVEKNLPLYYLALFSRSETAFKFWNDVLTYSTDQKNLWD